MSCEIPAPKIIYVKSDDLKDKEIITLKAEIERLKHKLFLVNLPLRKKI